MSKQGNRRLRHAIYQAARVAVPCDERMKTYYQEKIKLGKKRKVALGHCMRKVLLILWTLWKEGEKYDGDRMKKVG